MVVICDLVLEDRCGVDGGGWGMITVHQEVEKEVWGWWMKID